MMESNETDSLYKALSWGFHIAGYSADVIDFPSSGSEGYSSSESENEEPYHDLHKDLSVGFHIPGYSADVIDFPSSGSDASYSSTTDSEELSSCSKLSESEKYEQTCVPDVDADFGEGTSELESLKPGSAITKPMSVPPVPPRLPLAKRKTAIQSSATVIVGGQDLLPADRQKTKPYVGFAFEKMRKKTLENIQPKAIWNQHNKSYRQAVEGVGVLCSGEVVLCNNSKGCLSVFSPEGHCIALHTLPGALDVAGTPDGGMAAISYDTLYKLDTRGHELWNVREAQLPQRALPEGFDNGFCGVCVDNQGLIYTRLRDSVCVVGNDGVVIRHIIHSVLHFGRICGGIAIQPWGDLLLPDPKDGSIVVLSESGMIKTRLGGAPLQIEGSCRPFSIAADSTGNVAVSRYMNHTVTVYSPIGQCISTWGGFGTEPGKFAYPTGIAFTPSGDIIVCDGRDNRVQIFQLPTSS